MVDWITLLLTVNVVALLIASWAQSKRIDILSERVDRVARNQWPQESTEAGNG
jgi:hypothetical protein